VMSLKILGDGSWPKATISGHAKEREHHEHGEWDVD
jgi:hypothetical protein